MCTGLGGSSHSPPVPGCWPGPLNSQHLAQTPAQVQSAAAPLLSVPTGPSAQSGCTPTGRHCCGPDMHRVLLTHEVAPPGDSCSRSLAMGRTVHLTTPWKSRAAGASLRHGTWLCSPPGAMQCTRGAGGRGSSLWHGRAHVLRCYLCSSLPPQPHFVTYVRDQRIRDSRRGRALISTYSGSVSGVVSLGSVCLPPSWLGVRSSSVRTSTMGSLDSSFLQ